MFQLKPLFKSVIFVALLFSFSLLLFSCVEKDKKAESEKAESEITYSTNLSIKNDTVSRYGDDINVVINSTYNGVEITKIDVNPSRTQSSYPAKTLTIPHTVKKITDQSFFSLTNLEAFIVDERNPYFKSVDGVLYTKDGRVLLCYPAKKQDETFIVPDGVVIIAYYAFSNNDYLKEIALPETLTKIAEGAFSGVKRLEAINIPDSVTIIEKNAFFKCIALANVTLGQGLKTLGDEAFYHCNSIEKIVLPDSLTKIGVKVFMQCYSLKEVVLPSTIKEIPTAMFSSCTALRSIELPNTVTTIFENAFSATGLKEIIFPEGIKHIYGAFQNCPSLTGVTVPASVTFISDAFAKCKNLESLIFLGREINFADNPVRECTNLKEIHFNSVDDFLSMTFVSTNSDMLGGDVGLYIAGELITSFEFSSETRVINAGLFKGYKLLQSVIIPEGVEEIGRDVFQSCTGLTEIVLPSTLIKIDSHAFSYCTSLKTLYLPSIEMWLGITHYGDILSNVENLYIAGEKVTELIIPNGMEQINRAAFKNCDFLTSVYIPKTVRSLGYESFYYCVDLIFYYEGTMAEWKILDDESSEWYGYGDHYTIHCADGDITT